MPNRFRAAWDVLNSSARVLADRLERPGLFPFSASYVYRGIATGNVWAVNLMMANSIALGMGTLAVQERLDTPIESSMGRLLTEREQEIFNQSRSRAASRSLLLDWISPPVQGGIVVRGDDETPHADCWEQVLGPELVEKMDYEQRKTYRKHGMLLQDLASYCTPYVANNQKVLVLHNEVINKYFAFVIIGTIPAGEYRESPNSEYDVTMVHAIPVDCKPV